MFNRKNVRFVQVDFLRNWAPKVSKPTSALPRKLSRRDSWNNNIEKCFSWTKIYQMDQQTWFTIKDRITWPVSCLLWIYSRFEAQNNLYNVDNFWYIRTFKATWQFYRQLFSMNRYLTMSKENSLEIWV